MRTSFGSIANLLAGNDSFRRHRNFRRLTLETLEDRLPVNWQPLAANDAFQLTEDTPYQSQTLSVLDNDTDEDEDPLSALLVDGPFL
jgi:hypothetical protein